MGGGYKGRGSFGKAGKGRGGRAGDAREGRGAGGRGAYQDASVEPLERAFASKIDEHLSKAALRSYVGEAGPFFLQGAPDEETYFAPRAVMRSRVASNCEGVNRLGFFLSFFATNGECGSDLLDGVFKDGAQADTGISELLEAFGTDAGKGFSAACAYLNVKNNAKRAKKDTETHLDSLLSFLGKEPEVLHEAAVKMASLSARMYLFSISLIEMQSMLMNLKAWADAVPRDSHPPAVGRWKSDPESYDKLLAALQSVFEERLAEERHFGGGGGGVGGRDAARKRYSSPAGSTGGAGPRRASGGAYGDDDDDDVDEPAGDRDDDHAYGDDKALSRDVSADKDRRPPSGGSLWGRMKDGASLVARGRGASLWGSSPAGKAGRGAAAAAASLGRGRGGGGGGGDIDKETASRGADRRARGAERKAGVTGEMPPTRPASKAKFKLDLADEEEEESEEEAEEEEKEGEAEEADAVYAQWDKVHLKNALQILNVAVTTRADAKLPFKFTELQALTDGIPAAVLRMGGLENIPGTLKGMKNMPKRGKAMELLAALQKLAATSAERQRVAALASPAAKGPMASASSRKRPRSDEEEGPKQMAAVAAERQRAAALASPAAKFPAAPTSSRKRPRSEEEEGAAIPKERQRAGHSRRPVLKAEDEEDAMEEDAETEEMEDGAAFFDEWDKDHLKGALVTLAAAVSTGADGKIKLKITELQALADGIPESVLRLEELEGIPTALKKMKHLPKREKAMDILVALQRLAVAAEEHQLHTASASSAGAVPAVPPEAPGDGAVLRIRRLMSLGVISDKDPIDKVEITKEDTIADAVKRVFSTLGLEGALGEFNYRRVELVHEGHVTRAKMIPVEGTFSAVEAKEVVLCRKGG